MAVDSNFISNFVSSQFPQFYHEEGPMFITFIEAYYEWLEQSGNVIGESRDFLKNNDIDTTGEKFLSHFSFKYLNGIPDKVKFDKRFLIKHILDVYRSKGSIQGYRLLFRMIYNEDISIYLPGDDIFKTSDGTWYEPQFVEVEDNPNINNLIGKIVRGTSSNAQAVVEVYIKQPSDVKLNHILYLTNITGKFMSGEQLVAEDEINDFQTILSSPKILGSFVGLEVIQGGRNFSIGDTIVAVDGSGNGAECRVAEVANGTGTLTYTIIDGGSMFTTDAVSIITRTGDIKTGHGGSFGVGKLSVPRTQSYCIQLIRDGIDNIFGGVVRSLTIESQGVGYSNGDIVLFTPKYYVSDFTDIVRGSGYSNTDTITITGSGLSAQARIITNDDGSVYSIDVQDSGRFDSNNVTYNINTDNGTGASFNVLVVNTGMDASASISTDNNGAITQINGLMGGQLYAVPPDVSVVGVGSGAILTADVSNYFKNRGD